MKTENGWPDNWDRSCENDGRLDANDETNRARKQDMLYPKSETGDTCKNTSISNGSKFG